MAAGRRSACSMVAIKDNHTTVVQHINGSSSNSAVQELCVVKRGLEYQHVQDGAAPYILALSPYIETTFGALIVCRVGRTCIRHFTDGWRNSLTSKTRRTATVVSSRATHHTSLRLASRVASVTCATLRQSHGPPFTGPQCMYVSYTCMAFSLSPTSNVTHAAAQVCVSVK